MPQPARSADAPVTIPEAATAPATSTTTISASTLDVALHAQRNEFYRIGVFSGAGFVLLAVLIWRFGIARGKQMATEAFLARTARPREDERLQQAVDAIAIEVERLSEGQRFINNVMSARRPEREIAPLPPRITTPVDGMRITPH